MLRAPAAQISCPMRQRTRDVASTPLSCAEYGRAPECAGNVFCQSLCTTKWRAASQVPRTMTADNSTDSAVTRGSRSADSRRAAGYAMSGVMSKLARRPASADVARQNMLQTGPFSVAVKRT